MRACGRTVARVRRGAYRFVLVRSRSRARERAPVAVRFGSGTVFRAGWLREYIGHECAKMYGVRTVCIR